MTTQNFRIELAPQVTLTETNGKAVLFSKKTGDFFGLNDSAAYLIKELSGSDFLATLKKASEVFSVPEEDLSSDLTELVEDLEKQKLLRIISIP